MAVVDVQLIIKNFSFNLNNYDIDNIVKLHIMQSVQKREICCALR